MKKDLELKYKKDLKLALAGTPSFVHAFVDYTNLELELRTQVAYITDIKGFLQFISENYIHKAINQITLDDLNSVDETIARDYLSSVTEYTKTYTNKKGEPYTRTYTNTSTGVCRKAATLKKFYNFMVRKSWLTQNPFYDIHPKVPKKENINARLSVDDVQALENIFDEPQGIDTNLQQKAFERLKNRDLAMLLVLSYTGIRVSELVQLDIQDIDFPNSRLRIIRKNGKIAEIPFPDVISDHLFLYINERKVIQTDSKAVFLSQFKKRITTESVRNIIKKYAQRANISVEVTCHTFRRTLLTNLYNQTGDLELVRKIAGHEMIETTRKYYTAIDEDRLNDTVQRFSYK